MFSTVLLAITVSLMPGLNPGLDALGFVMKDLYAFTRDTVSSSPRYLYGSMKASAPNFTTVASTILN